MDNMIQLNKLTELVEPSRSVELLKKTKELQAVDSEVLNFTAGEPDFDTPEAVVREAFRQLSSGNTHYSDAKGDPELRARLAEKLARENHAPYSADNILITPGGKYAVYAAVQAMVNPGDEVMWLSPGWVSYPAIVTLCGGTPVKVGLEYESEYRITAELLEAHTTDRTKLLILNYPNNPTGRILTESDMRELKDYLTRHPNIYVLSDEIYEKLVYDGHKNLSPASDSELFDRVLLVNGFSKCSAMTGWRIGYLACGPKIYASVLKIFQHSMSCTAGFIQKAAIKALEVEADTERMRAAYEERRNVLIKGIERVPRADCMIPEGAFYLWVRFDTELNSEELCDKLLTEAKVAGIPGTAFGETKYTMVRFCFASDEKKLEELLRRLEVFCGNLKG